MTNHLNSQSVRFPAVGGRYAADCGLCGAGYGSPFEREPDKVAADVRDGLIDETTARKVYGVVINKGLVDLEKTNALRSGSDGPD